MDWSIPPFYIWMCLALGVGAYVLSVVVHYYWRGSQIPKKHAGWVTELDAASRDLINAEMHRAICYRRVADLIGEMPADFNALALTGMHLSDAVGRAVLAKAEQLGIYPEGTFASLGVIPHELPPPEPEPTGGANGSTVVPWVGNFIDGRLVPAAKRLMGAGPPN